MTSRSRLGQLRRTQPLSSVHGFDRGTPIDRYYIEQFLQEHAGDIHGSCLEVGDARHTERFGSRVSRSDVLDVVLTNPRATIVADLVRSEAIRSDRFDCFLLIQTLHLIYEVSGAIHHCHRILKPGGVLLATLPAVGRIPNLGDGMAYWRFTPASCERLFTEAFGPGNVDVRAYGNVLTCTTHLMGMAFEELSEEELNLKDDMFPLVVVVRVVKATP